MFSSGELRRMIDEDGLHGITSNPSIFEKAIAESNLYDKDIHDLVLKKIDIKEIYETLSIKDVRLRSQALRLHILFIKKYLRAGSSKFWPTMAPDPRDCYGPAPVLKIPIIAILNILSK